MCVCVFVWVLVSVCMLVKYNTARAASMHLYCHDCCMVYSDLRPATCDLRPAMRNDKCSYTYTHEPGAERKLGDKGPRNLWRWVSNSLSPRELPDTGIMV